MRLIQIIKLLCLSLIMILDLASCKDSTDENKSVEFADSYNEITKWCSCSIFIQHGSGNYDFEVNDKEGIKWSYNKDLNDRITIQGLKEGIYSLKVIDKEKNESSTTIIKVLPQAVIISIIKSDDALFSQKHDGLVLMGDTENKCFILHHIPPVSAYNYSSEPIFEGFYDIEEKDGKPSTLLLRDQNKIIVRTYTLDGTSEEALQFLKKLKNRQSWGTNDMFLSNGSIILKDNQRATNAKLILAYTFLPQNFYK